MQTANRVDWTFPQCLWRCLFFGDTLADKIITERARRSLSCLPKLDHWIANHLSSVSSGFYRPPQAQTPQAIDNQSYSSTIDGLGCFAFPVERTQAAPGHRTTFRAPQPLLKRHVLPVLPLFASNEESVAYPRWERDNTGMRHIAWLNLLPTICQGASQIV